MGGDKFPFSTSSTEEESVVEDDFKKQPLGLSTFLQKSVVFEANQRQKLRIYEEVLRGYEYDDVDNRIEHLEEAKRKILSYTPGSLMGNTNEELLSHYDVPKTTALLLIGPKGSGKSSLVNKLSRMFDDNVFATERAPVSNNSSAREGTYFIQEYTIPRGSNSLCVYDTRSLSDNTSENLEEFHHWVTKGIYRRQPVLRNSDDKKLIASISCKAHQYGNSSSKARMVNFVIFVVNGVSVLEDMANNNEEDKSCTKRIASEFNNPLLSFTDDRPAVVVTHGDLLPITDRARVRIYLGELFGVPPHSQIFDIPESSDPVTKLSTVDMILYCLERADRNLPYKGRSLDKMRRTSRFASRFLLMLVIAVLSVITWSAVSPHIFMNKTSTPNSCRYSSIPNSCRYSSTPNSRRYSSTPNSSRYSSTQNSSQYSSTSTSQNSSQDSSTSQNSSQDSPTSQNSSQDSPTSQNSRLPHLPKLKSRLLHLHLAKLKSILLHLHVTSYSSLPISC